MTEQTDWHILDTLASVTDEVMAHAVSIADDRYPDGGIVWADVWDRLDGVELESGAKIEIPYLFNAALTKIKRHVHALRRADGEMIS